MVSVGAQNWSSARRVLSELRAAGLFPATLLTPEDEPALTRDLEARLLAAEAVRTEAEVADRQRGLLAALLADAAAETPWYRASLPSLARVGETRIGEARLDELPFLTRGDLYHHGEELIADRFRDQPLSRKRTSGTSGMPVTVVQSEAEAFSTLVYDPARVARLAGYPSLERWASPYALAVTDNPSHPPFGTWSPLLEKWCRFEVIDSLVPETVQAVLDLLDQLEPALLLSRPTALRALAEGCAGRPPRRGMPLGVICSGDNFHSDDRARVRAALDAEVVDLYAISECSGVAALCREAGRYHVCWELAWVEIVDPATGRPREDEEPGEIVVTDLTRRAMPIVRYRTGDWGRRALGPCPCGRPGPTLLSIDGREGCYFRLPDGRLLNPTRLNYPLSILPGLRQFRLAQVAPDGLQMDILRGEAAPADLEERIREVIASHLPVPMTLRIEAVESLGRPGTKILRYVSRL